MLRDGYMHFSDLKLFAKSPAHYRHAISSEDRVETRGMRIGSGVDRMVFGGEILLYEGDRRGKTWKEFFELHKGALILTSTESVECSAISQAVTNSHVACDHLRGMYQVPMTWEYANVPCRTRGIDILGDGWLADLKVTHSAEPNYLMRHARSQLWHAQLAFYMSGQEALGTPCSKAYLICVESIAPYNVTVLDATDMAQTDGARCISSWIEQYKNCVASESWHGYTQSVVKMEGSLDGIAMEFDE